MTTPREPDAIIAAWLEEGPNRLPEATRRAIAVSTRTSQQQRRPTWMPRTTSSMHPFTRMAVAAIAVGGAVYLLAPGNQNGGVGAPPSAVPSSAQTSATSGPTPSPSSAPIDTETWTTYTSARYGFSIGHPADWSEHPADHDWTFAADAADTSSPAQFTAWELFVAPDDSIGISARSVAVTPGTTVEAWLQAYCPVAENDSTCATIQDQAIVIRVDGHVGLLVPFKSDTQAFIVVDNRMYVVASWRPAAEYDSLRLLQAYLSTLRLLPGGPAPAAAAPPAASSLAPS